MAALKRYAVLIVGAGAAGIAVAASLRKRAPGLAIALIDPAQTHDYQPGWTLVGAGVFSAQATRKPMAGLIPPGVEWLAARVAGIDPHAQAVTLEGAGPVGYDQLIVCPGLVLDWAGIEGLEATLGQHGVTSNYRYDLAPYTWQLTQQLRQGHAVFTQPPMPIKCAGAPQKAMYLACDHWRGHGRLASIRAHFHSAAPALFGVAAYVPALMGYIERYQIGLHLQSTLVAVDGPGRVATFQQADGTRTAQPFDMLHVVPPQRPPAWVADSGLGDASGWLAVDPHHLRHTQHANVHGLGDVIGCGNAKTAAAVRQQAPVVAHNVLHALGREAQLARYNGYGACPLTVERGKVVLAEFGYGGALTPTLPTWLLEGRQPSRLAWWLKADVLRPLYWHGMLKGREWLLGRQ